MAIREQQKDPAEVGEIQAPKSRCEVCGQMGETIYRPGGSPPNRFCLRCAVEYGNSVGGDYDDY